MIVIGIDPGLTGACAFINTRTNAAAVFDLPTMELPGNGMIRRKIDGLALAQLLRIHAPLDEDAAAFLEQVGVMGGPKGKTNALQIQGSLCRTLGAIEAVLECFRRPPTMVQPQVWKRSYGLAADKELARAKAGALYPALAADLKRVKDHNRAEAVLIAHYGVRRIA